MSRVLSPARSIKHLTTNSLQAAAHKNKEQDSKCPAMGTAPLKAFNDIPGPKGHMVIGTLWDYIKKDGYRFETMFKTMQARAWEYGPVYKERIMNRTSVVVSDPDEYVKVIRVDGKYPNRTEMEPMAYHRQSTNVTLGTVNSQGEEWHRHRTVLNKKLLRPQEVIVYCPAMNAVTEDLIAIMKAKRTSEGFIPNMEIIFFRWALESIAMLLFEDRIGSLDEPPVPATVEYIDHLLGYFGLMQPLMYNMPIYKLYPTATWCRYKHHADEVWRIGNTFIAKRAEALKAELMRGDSEREYEPLLTYLLCQPTLTLQEINAHAVDMMTGGVETTSNAMLWTLLCLARNPEAQEALHTELFNELSGSHTITAGSLQRLPYLKACLKEMFRLYPITFATSRIIAKDIELGGYHVPAGTHVQANLYGMGHDPALFPDPESYQPDRWLRQDQDDMDDKEEIHSSKLLANLFFGHGARMCIGRRIAEQEIYIAIAKIVLSFKLALKGPPPEPVLKTIMTPDGPLRLIYTPR